MSLVLEIECLTGVYRAAQGPASELPDWPPQPDRVFSALVSAWAVRGERRDERVALEWLEARKPPTVRASSHVARTAPDVFVPPNDVKASKAEKTYIKVMPDRRPRQPRRFPVARPDEPVMALIWKEEPDAALYEALDAMVRDIGYLGHSASFGALLVPPRRFGHVSASRSASPAANLSRPLVRAGSGASRGSGATRHYARRVGSSDHADGGRSVTARLAGARSDRCRRRSGYPRRCIGLPRAAAGADERLSARGTRWRDPGDRVRAYRGPRTKPASASCHRTAGVCRLPARRRPGVRFRPRAAGRNETSGYPGAAPSFRADRAIRRWKTASCGNANGISAADDAASRAGGRYNRAFSVADTVPMCSPGVGQRDAHCARPASQAERRGRDPRHRRRRVRARWPAAARHGPDPGPASTQLWRVRRRRGPLVGAPPWTRWKVPESLATRSLIHAAIDFGREIPGPVLLGAGRFTGLGLCRRLES